MLLNSRCYIFTFSTTELPILSSPVSNSCTVTRQTSMEHDKFFLTKRCVLSVFCIVFRKIC